MRAKANALSFQGRCREAVTLLEEASGLFEKLALADEVGRTLSTSIQPLILLGEYQCALRKGKKAREIFSRHNDGLRLARLDINLANVYHRQERFAEALTRYERAYQLLLPHRDIEGLACALHNMAVCLVSLDDFTRAMRVYRRARRFFETHAMPRLEAQADYNIAYLFYLRGDYEPAIQKLLAARETCAKDDPYHAALCDLDLSHIYLDINLAHEAESAARRAAAGFEALGIGYEAATALNNLGIAASRKGEPEYALAVFARAKELFAAEHHEAGESLIDLHQAVLLFDKGDFAKAGELCSHADSFFRSAGMSRKAAICRLLSARISLVQGDLAEARKRCDAVFEQLEGIQAPALYCEAKLLRGQIHEALGQAQKAAQSYEEAAADLEALRSRLQGDELRIAFASSRLAVYDHLLRLSLRERDRDSAERAFLYVEKAKCRSLADSMVAGAQCLTRGTAQIAGADSSLRTIRAELNWFYHRIRSAELRHEGRSLDTINKLWEQARAREDELIRILRESTVTGAEQLQAVSSPLPVSEIRASMDSESTLLEYFEAGDRIHAAVITSSGIEMVPLAPVSRLRRQLQMLRFQFSKFHLGPAHVQQFAPALQTATDGHLRQLYRDLVSPLRGLLKGAHLIVVPHGPLHCLPFHALAHEDRYLIDEFAISYAPSATVYALMQRRPSHCGGPPLILGVPDDRAPWILDEAQEVAAALPDSRLLLGESATFDALRTRGPRSRVIHIAAHGLFRTDNPLFSAVKLGNSYLSLYDLDSVRLPASLLTLSGCGTGLNVIAGGDEILGLARGLLCGGVETLLLSLWDVNDRSTAEFMRLFYTNLQTGSGKLTAYRAAAVALRRRYPHPYYWAPFVMIGKAP
jgi:CHAT domain-containing protein